MPQVKPADRSDRCRSRIYLTIIRTRAASPLTATGGVTGASPPPLPGASSAIRCNQPSSPAQRNLTRPQTQQCPGTNKYRGVACSGHQPSNQAQK